MANKEIIKLREKIIGYIYSYELLNQKLNSDNAFEAGTFKNKEILLIDKISKNYEIFKKIISLFIKKDWKWERISAINRAILIYGTFELSFNDKGLVIDVMIKYSKEFVPDNSFKFINFVLDKVGDYLEKIKNSKKKS
ncbi:MAG: transcription antitermination protein NusB [Mycoplasmatales bacterium]|nr:transcription antitermination protein NusB [Mycoplasmatales bacterium]